MLNNSGKRAVGKCVAENVQRQTNNSERAISKHISR